MNSVLKICCIVLAILVMGGVSVEQIRAQNVPELMYFKFNETGGSTTENFASAPVGTNPAPVVGLTMGSSGQFGSALVGNGLASGTNAVNTGWLTAFGSGEWTISLWLNNFPATAATTFYFFGDAGGSAFRCFTGGVAGNNALLLRGTGLTDVPVTAIGSAPIVIHFVHEVTPSNVVKVYRNGVLANTVAQTAPNLTGTGGFKVGGYSTSNSFSAGCLMDEFRMYNRALSDVEVAATWNASLPLGTPGWNAQTSGITTALYSVKAVSGQIAWACGAGGVVRRTTDGGVNWTGVGGGNIGAQDLYAIDAISANTAFVTGTPSTTAFMFRTTNGGTSWDTVFTQAGGFLDAIKMYDATNGIAYGDPVGGKWVILRTTNGGASWARIATEPNQVGGEAGSNNGLATVGTSHIWFCSNSVPPSVYRSTDAGATWSSSNLPGTATFTAGIAFNGTQYGVAGGNNGNAARTTDGGVTWSAVTVGTTGAIYGMAGAGTFDFWATRGTTFQRSTNRGGTWAQEFADATSGTLWHTSFVTSGTSAYGWTVTGSGKIYAYFNPVSVHDLGVQSLAKVFSTNDQARLQHTPPGLAQESREVAPDMVADAGAISDDGAVANQAGSGLVLYPLRGASFSLADTVGFRAIVKNFGNLNEASYQLGWQIDGVNQTPINRGAIAAEANDTMTFQWNQAVTGVHTLRAWTTLAEDNNHGNDTATLPFNVGRVPGDTLYTFRILPTELLLGIAKMGPSNKIVITSGGASNTLTTDNKWVVTDMHGTILDSTHYQINNTAAQGFGFRDLAWDGRWLLTSDDTRIRRIDTATFTELVPPIVTVSNPNRGIATMSPNRIWVSNFTTNPVNLYDSTGATIRSLGIPTVAPYGIAFDKWTSRTRAFLWYAQPSLAGQIRLSKVDTATGAILQTFDYSSQVPATSSSGGLDIINDHPEYPGAVVALMVTQLGPGGIISVIYLGQDSSTVGVDEQSGGIPDAFALEQNYPNPFNPTTTLRYALPKSSHVTLSIHNVLGQRVATVRNDVQGPGVHDVVWNGLNDSGTQVASGVYFYRMEATPVDGGAALMGMKKMVLLK